MSYRSALENLLNAIGGDLDVPLVATHELADAGDRAGRPDFGMFEKKSGNPRCVGSGAAPKQYVLASTFIADRHAPATEPGFDVGISGAAGRTFNPPQPLNDEPWFDAMLR